MNSIKDTRQTITINIEDWLVTIQAGLNTKKFSSKDLRLVELKNVYGDNKFVHSDTGIYAGETKISSIRIYLDGVAEPLQYSVVDYTDYSIVTVFKTLSGLVKEKD